MKDNYIFRVPEAESKSILEVKKKWAYSSLKGENELRKSRTVQVQLSNERIVLAKSGVKKKRATYSQRPSPFLKVYLRWNSTKAKVWSEMGWLYTTPRGTEP